MKYPSTFTRLFFWRVLFLVRYSAVLFLLVIPVTISQTSMEKRPLGKSVDKGETSKGWRGYFPPRL